MKKKVYVLTRRHDDVFIDYGKRCEVNEHDYVHLLDEGVAYPRQTVLVNGVESVRGELPDRIELPADVVTGGPWCYTKEDGWFKNPDWVTPETTPAPEAEAAPDAEAEADAEAEVKKDGED